MINPFVTAAPFGRPALRLAGALIAMVTLSASLPSASAAQVRTPERDTTASLPRAHATRAELERELADERSGRKREARIRALQSRLENGDIRPGDRIALMVEGEVELTDTFTVRPNRTVDLPNIPTISVAGLLRSEVEPHLRQEIAKYIRDPRVRADALIRIAVLGEVGSPGFYTVGAEMPIPDVVMIAGGPTGNANLDKSRVERGQEVVRDRDEVRQSLAAGESLDQMNLQSGDQLIIGEKGSGLLRTLGYIGSAAGTIYFITRIF